MKNKVSHACFLLVIFLAASCGSKKAETVANNNEWPEMDEFHMIMAESFHPFKDSANIEPAKANASQLAKSAEKWINAPLPAKVDTEETKATLAQLKTEADAFIQIAQQGDTAAIGASLTSMHDTFHKLKDIWYGLNKEDEHDGHQH